MAVPAVSTYVASVSGQPVSGGRWPGGRLAGNITLNEIVAGGSLASNLSALTGNVDLGPIDVSGVFNGLVTIPAGSIATLAQTNTITSVDPKNNASVNPNYPAAPPWEPTGTGWVTVVDYGGWVFAKDLGVSGSLITYAGAGHSTTNPLCVVRFDLENTSWSIHGIQPIPSNALLGYTPGSPPTGFDETWGDWDPNSASFGAAFRQTLSAAGYRVEGGHMRNRQVYVPAALAGNASGWLVLTHRVGGVNDAVGTMGASHYIDLDTGKCHRFNGLRPGYGAVQGAATLHPGLGSKGIVACNSQPIASTAANHIDYVDLATGLWTRRSYTSGGYFWNPDDTGFQWTDGSGNSWHIHVINTTANSIAAFGVNMTAAYAGSALSNVGLTFGYSTLPSGAGGSMNTASWARRSSDGCYYAVSRAGGSKKVWKMTPPASGVISGTWAISEQTLTGDNIVGKTLDYASLVEVPGRDYFLWVGGDQTAITTQRIRPN